MRKALLAGAMLAALSGAAIAADLPYRPRYGAPALVGYDWIGPYLGGHLGHQWTGVSNSGAEPSGLAGGVQAGVNWQSGSFVLGGEADLTLSAGNERFAAWKFANPWFGTLRARGGIAMDNVLVYGTVGFAYGRGRVELGGSAESSVHYGWTAGLGLEVGLTRNWSARAEYLFLSLGDQLYLLTGNRHGLDVNMLRLGVNYRF